MTFTHVAMWKKIWLASLSALAMTQGCSKTETERHDEPKAGEETPKGPHGGRVLDDGKFSVEVTIFERGVPPEFRVFARESTKPIEPSDVKLAIELRRFGGRVDRIEFAPNGDHLLGNGAVEEPHSFDVHVYAEYAGKLHEWTYSSYEGRTTIATAMAKEAGVTIATAGPGKLSERLTLYGTIKADPARQRKVAARYPGVIQTVFGQVGDNVRAGDTLAVIESNESLQSYPLKAPIAGTITVRQANAGETAGAEALFEIADFAAVRAELAVFPGDFSKLRKGQAVAIRSAHGKNVGLGTVSYLAAAGSANDQSLVAQVLLDNKQGAWTPGLFVSAEVPVNATLVAIAVPTTALQKFREWDVVFLNDGETYQAQPLELGRSDGETTEVVSGLSKGDRYVATNSYLIKADIEKSGASHDH